MLTITFTLVLQKETTETKPNELQYSEYCLFLPYKRHFSQDSPAAGEQAYERGETRGEGAHSGMQTPYSLPRR